jgi:hypothetical protein
MYSLDHPAAFFIALVALLLLLVEIGFRFASRSSVNEDPQQHEQIAAARYGSRVLLSLLLGFTLTVSLPRYERRKQLIADEANDVGTRILRAQAFPDPAGTEERALLRQYVDARMAYSEDGLGAEEIRASVQRASALQAVMWNIAAELAKKNPTCSTGLFLQALNDAIDVSEKRIAAREYRVPQALWIYARRHLRAHLPDRQLPHGQTFFVRNAAYAADDWRRPHSCRGPRHSPQRFHSRRTIEHGALA